MARRCTCGMLQQLKRYRSTPRYVSKHACKCKEVSNCAVLQRIACVQASKHLHINSRALVQILHARVTRVRKSTPSFVQENLESMCSEHPCMHVHAHVHTHEHARAHAHTHSRAHAYTLAQTRTSMRASTHTRKITHMRTRTLSPC